MKETVLNRQKLAKLQTRVRIGGKGTARIAEKGRWFTEQLQQMIKKTPVLRKEIGGKQYLWYWRRTYVTDQGRVTRFNNPEVQAGLSGGERCHHYCRADA